MLAAISASGGAAGLKKPGADDATSGSGGGGGGGRGGLLAAISASGGAAGLKKADSSSSGGGRGGLLAAISASGGASSLKKPGASADVGGGGRSDLLAAIAGGRGALKKSVGGHDVKGGRGGGGRGVGLMAALSASGGRAGLRKVGRRDPASPRGDDLDTSAPCPRSKFVEYFSKFCSSARARLATADAVITDAVALSKQTVTFFGESAGSKPQDVFAVLVRFVRAVQYSPALKRANSAAYRKQHRLLAMLANDFAIAVGRPAITAYGSGTIEAVREDQDGSAVAACCVVRLAWGQAFVYACNLAVAGSTLSTPLGIGTLKCIRSDGSSEVQLPWGTAFLRSRDLALHASSTVPDFSFEDEEEGSSMTAKSGAAQGSDPDNGSGSSGGGTASGGLDWKAQILARKKAKRDIAVAREASEMDKAMRADAEFERRAAAQVDARSAYIRRRTAAEQRATGRLPMAPAGAVELEANPNSVVSHPGGACVEATAEGGIGQPSPHSPTRQLKGHEGAADSDYWSGILQAGLAEEEDRGATCTGEDILAGIADLNPAKPAQDPKPAPVPAPAPMPAPALTAAPTAAPAPASAPMVAAAPAPAPAPVCTPTLTTAPALTLAPTRNPAPATAPTTVGLFDSDCDSGSDSDSFAHAGGGTALVVPDAAAAAKAAAATLFDDTSSDDADEDGSGGGVAAPTPAASTAVVPAAATTAVPAPTPVVAAPAPFVPAPFVVRVAAAPPRTNNLDVDLSEDMGEDYWASVLGENGD